MEASIGKALREARLQKTLSLQDVAQVTKIHPERLDDLERDEYAHFPSLAYARNFLMLYARFLGVDASKYPVIDVGRPVLTGEYEYLKSVEAKPIGASRSALASIRRKPRRRSRWLIAFGVLITATTIGALTAFLILDFRRLPSLEQLLNRGNATPEAGAATPAPSPDGAEPSADPTPAAAATPAEDVEAAKATEAAEATEPAKDLAPVRSGEVRAEGGLLPVADPEASDRELLATAAEIGSFPAPIPAPAQTVAAPAASPSIAPSPVATPSAVAGRENPNRLPGGATPAAPAPAAATPALAATAAPTPASSPSPTPQSEPLREVTIRATKKARVRVTRDVRGSAPVFDGWLEPDQAPLHFQGRHFWVESRNPGALQITSDGKQIGQTGAPRHARTER